MPWEVLPFNSPILPIHGALLPPGTDGRSKVFFFAGSSNNPDNVSEPRGSALWDYENGDVFERPLTPVDPNGDPIDIFCAGQSLLSDGNLLVTGGTESYDIPGFKGFSGGISTLIFDRNSKQWRDMAAMAGGRWYPTQLTLGNGLVLTVSGLAQDSTINEIPEIYDAPADTWSSLPDTDTRSDYPLYAHLFLLEDGRVFFSGAYFSNNNGVLPRILDLGTNTETPIPGLLRPDGRDQAASVLLPPAQDQRVMVIGGGAGDPATLDAVDIVDLKSSSPTYRPTEPLNNRRMHHNAVLLPDRTVFVCGGSGISETPATLPAEIYNPRTETWTEVEAEDVPRLYHSIALLLPDGRIVSAGGNPKRLNECGLEGTIDGTIDGANCEELRLRVYSPAYISQPRPEISTAPKTIFYGETIAIDTPQASDILWVSLIRPMATTHAYDVEQRLVDLPIVSRTDTSVNVSLEDNPNLTPVGFYMLFITDNSMVPSVAAWIEVLP